jgi:hypothetical protein
MSHNFQRTSYDFYTHLDVDVTMIFTFYTLWFLGTEIRKSCKNNSNPAKLWMKWYPFKVACINFKLKYIGSIQRGEKLGDL